MGKALGNSWKGDGRKTVGKALGKSAGRALVKHWQGWSGGGGGGGWECAWSTVSVRACVREAPPHNWHESLLE